MVKIESAEGKEKEISCIGCALHRKQIKPVGERIAETKNFEVSQDYEIPIPGFAVISSKRHIIGFADFTAGEKKEFIDLVCNLSKTIRSVLNVKYLQILCREDAIDSKVNPSHFHFALLPRYDWMKKYDNTGEVLEYARKNLKTKENLVTVKKVATQIKKRFKSQT